MATGHYRISSYNQYPRKNGGVGRVDILGEYQSADLWPAMTIDLTLDRVFYLLLPSLPVPGSNDNGSVSQSPVLNCQRTSSSSPPRRPVQSTSPQSMTASPSTTHPSPSPSSTLTASFLSISFPYFGSHPGLRLSTTMMYKYKQPTVQRCVTRLCVKPW